MEVICIDASNIHTLADKLHEGHTYTVIRESISGIGYVLREAKARFHDKGYGYLKSRFIPISSIDETESEAYKQRQLQTV